MCALLHLIFLGSVNADADAEVIALTPKKLLESDRYVCEICSKGFQRDQNLQMHKRRHKVSRSPLLLELTLDRVQIVFFSLWF